MKIILLSVLLIGGLMALLACSKTDSVSPSTSTSTSTSTTAASASATSTTATSTTATVVKLPDKKFEQALIDLGVDSDKTVNGQLSNADAQKVTSINIAFKSISDLTGIEGFTNLTALMCGYNKLTTLDLSANTGLVKLVCHYNSLTGKLNLKPLKSLSSLDALGNPSLTTVCVPNVATAQANASFQKDATAVYDTCP